jgi:Tol biopolymer transport system component
LYTSIRPSDFDIEVASVDLATGKQTAPPVKASHRFSGSNTQPTWSPDGKALAFTSARDNGFIVAIRSTGTGEIRELRPTLSWFVGLSWAPNGQSFAVFGTDLKGRNGVFRIDAHSGEVTPIAVPVAMADRLSYEGLFWSPDGKRLYYHSQNGTVHERDLASGTDRVVAGRPSPISLTPPDGKLGPISLSPNGRWIVSHRSDASGKSAVVVLIPVSGGEPRDLLRVSLPEGVNNTSMPWTPDGRGILVRKTTAPDHATSELWLVPIDGTTPRKLEFDANRVAPYAAGKIQLHPDGHQLAFVSGHLKNMEVWVLENFLPSTK